MYNISDRDNIKTRCQMLNPGTGSLPVPSDPGSRVLVAPPLKPLQIR